MPRPTNRTCARCNRAVVQCPDHLGNTYDHYVLKTRGHLNQDEGHILEIDQELIEYALNRMLALDRDNGNKAEGKPATRIYRSRNVRVGDALSSRCHVRRGVAQCMRPAGHQPADAHKF